MITAFYSPMVFPAWVFVEFTQGDKEFVYDIHTARAKAFFISTEPAARVVLLKTYWDFNKPIGALVTMVVPCPNWVIQTQTTWLAHINQIRDQAAAPPPAAAKKLKVPTKGMEKNFWPTIRALSGLKDEMVKKILCQ